MAICIRAGLPPVFGASVFNRLLGRLRGLWLALTAEAQPERIASDEVSANAARLLDSYGNSILRLAYSYMHNMSDAVDIVQETLIRYLQKTPSFESPAHEKAWLLHVAANLCKNRLDYERIRKTDELNEELAAAEDENLSFVWEEVKALPEQYRAPIHLFYQEGYSTSEIAKILGRKESTVRSDLHRGRERLKAVLKEAYDFE